jgi:hypothetical protein
VLRRRNHLRSFGPADAASRTESPILLRRGRAARDAAAALTANANRHRLSVFAAILRQRGAAFSSRAGLSSSPVMECQERLGPEHLLDVILAFARKAIIELARWTEYRHCHALRLSAFSSAF